MAVVGLRGFPCLYGPFPVLHLGAGVWRGGRVCFVLAGIFLILH